MDNYIFKRKEGGVIFEAVNYRKVQYHIYIILFTYLNHIFKSKNIQICINDNKFKTQALGRINRMPELKHYGEELLDSAHVFANVSKYIHDDPNKFKVKTPQRIEEETVSIKTIMIIRLNRKILVHL